LPIPRRPLSRPLLSTSSLHNRARPDAPSTNCFSGVWSQRTARSSFFANQSTSLSLLWASSRMDSPTTRFRQNTRHNAIGPINTHRPQQRIEDGVLVEHWDVIQDEMAKEQSKSGRPMFGDSFPAYR